MDTPVMLIFFNRPEMVKQSFGWIQRVKPKQLFLVQDGARPNNAKDVEKIEECRKIVENVDWECEVHKNYAEANLSCDVREYTGIDWCFEHVDRLIILEDDCIPADSFYEFCGELLERYENDTRVNAISGFLRCGKVDNAAYDYVFSHSAAGLGWATWKRAWWEARDIYNLKLEEYEELLQKYKSTVESYYPSYKDYCKKAINLRRREIVGNKLISWENIWGLSMVFHNQVTISPKVNMIRYAGVAEGATHSHQDIRLLPKAMRKMFTQAAFDIHSPLNHPPFIVRDLQYEEKDYKAYFGKSKFLLRLEVLFLKLWYRKKGK